MPKYLIPPDYDLKPLPAYGDLMTLSDFVEECNFNNLLDCDGSGRYAFKDQISNREAVPSDVVNGIIDLRFTHVMWFNK